MRETDSRDSGSPTTPTWVKVFAIVAGLAVVAFVVLLLMGGHGPQRHGAADAPLALAAASR